MILSNLKDSHEDSACKSEKHQAFIKEEVLVVTHDVVVCVFLILKVLKCAHHSTLTDYICFCLQDIVPCTAELFSDLLLKDNSTFTNEYRPRRKDKDITVSVKLADD